MFLSHIICVTADATTIIRDWNVDKQPGVEMTITLWFLDTSRLRVFIIVVNVLVVTLTIKVLNWRGRGKRMKC